MAQSKLTTQVNISVSGPLGVVQLVLFPHGANVTVCEDAVEGEAVAVKLLNKLRCFYIKVT